jgi:hypothetical protein
LEASSPSTALTIPDAPTPLDDLARLGTWLAMSESGDESPKTLGASAALRLYYLEQLDLPPFAAGQLSVIKGRLFVGAELIRALALRAGYKIDRVDDDATTATAVLSKDGVELGRTTFTIEDARKAGLIRPRSPWETHPARMLWARASKYVVTDYAPHVALGLALDDEIIEYAGSQPDNGVVIHTTYYPSDSDSKTEFQIPADVQAENEKRVEAELSKHADEVEEADD